jgi:DDE superfamily endonuclease
VRLRTVVTADAGCTWSRRAHAGGPGLRPGIRPDLGRRADPLQGRAAEPVLLPDARPRLRPDTCQAMSEADHAALITAAHRYLHAPVVVIWDNPNTYLSRKMRAFTTGHPDWLTVIQLPAYAPELDPVEGIWSLLKRPWPTSPPAPQTSSPPLCGTSWTASSDRPRSSQEPSARPGLPSNQNRPDQTVTFEALLAAN